MNEDLYERIIGGKVEYRKAPAAIRTSKVARKQWAEQGWAKAVGQPVGVSTQPTKQKASKKKDEPTDDAVEQPVYESE